MSIAKRLLGEADSLVVDKDGPTKKSRLAKQNQRQSAKGKSAQQAADYFDIAVGDLEIELTPKDPDFKFYWFNNQSGEMVPGAGRPPIGKYPVSNG